MGGRGDMSDSVKWQNLKIGDLCTKQGEIKRAHPVDRHQYKKEDITVQREQKKKAKQQTTAFFAQREKHAHTTLDRWRRQTNETKIKQTHGQ